MRTAFLKTFMESAEKDKNIYLLVGDLGFSVFEDFAKKFPNRYVNCGVAEQNMMGIAAGLALTGKKVVVYSIIPFVTMRCFEQIRNDICLQNLDVKIIGIGGGYSYGQLGATHHSIEDIAIMKSLPNMNVLIPADPIETKLLVKNMMEHNSPTYLRLGKSKEENLYNENFSFKVGRANVLRNGRSLAIIGMGPILKNALKAADILIKDNIICKVVSISTIKPIDEKAIIESAKTGFIVTVEEHNIIGGLGDSVAAILAQAGLTKFCRFKKIGIEDKFIKTVGDQEYLRFLNGFSPEKLAESISLLINKN